jgi:hypothetical protein
MATITEQELRDMIVRREIRVGGQGPYAIHHACPGHCVPQPLIQRFQTEVQRVQWVEMRLVPRTTFVEANASHPTAFFCCQQCRRSYPAVHYFVEIAG